MVCKLYLDSTVDLKKKKGKEERTKPGVTGVESIFPKNHLDQKLGNGATKRQPRGAWQPRLLQVAVLLYPAHKKDQLKSSPHSSQVPRPLHPWKRDIFLIHPPGEELFVLHLPREGTLTYFFPNLHNALVTKGNPSGDLQGLGRVSFLPWSRYQLMMWLTWADIFVKRKVGEIWEISLWNSSRGGKGSTTEDNQRKQTNAPNLEALGGK